MWMSNVLVYASYHGDLDHIWFMGRVLNPASVIYIPLRFSCVHHNSLKCVLTFFLCSTRLRRTDYIRLVNTRYIEVFVPLLVNTVKRCN